MDAVARLAAVTAHEFNNILSTIGGMTSLVLEELPEGQARTDLTAVSHAVERGAAITRRLLVISGHQPVFHETLHLGELINGMSLLLRSPSRDDIGLLVDAPSDLGGVRADKSQIELIVAILAANARDAMPDGGTLHIAISELAVTKSSLADWAGAPVGDYVVLSVRDNGTGMDEEVKAHLFEPFFTTKDIGKGTGLGLATVYGIVRQSGGFIRVESELGKGTTVTLLLPRI
jgi:signal transduction histidine kinase